MTKLEHFSVQTINRDDIASSPQCVAVEAASPVHAGEIVLGSVLSLHGTETTARAIVWRMTDDFVPLGTTLYDPNP